MINKNLLAKITTSSSHPFSIKIKDCGEDLVSLNDEFTVKPFWLDKNTLNREIEGKYYLPYIAEHPSFELKVRAGVLKRLITAKEYLPAHWKVIIKAGFRPLEVQQSMFQDFLEKVRIEHSDWSSKRCLEYASQYITNADEVIPPHATGGAIDIDIYDTSSKNLVDMGGKMCELGELSHCLNSKLTKAQRSNQGVLLAAMCKAGFAPLSSEWWHFSYGDQRWAAFYNKKNAIYNAVNSGN